MQWIGNCHNYLYPISVQLGQYVQYIKQKIKYVIVTLIGNMSSYNRYNMLSTLNKSPNFHRYIFQNI